MHIWDVKDYNDCARNCVRAMKTHHLKFFHSSGPLEFTLSPLPKTRTCNQFIIVMTDCFSKFIRVVPSTSTTAPHVASIFIDHWLVLCRIPAYLLTNSQPQFVFNFFMRLSAKILGLKHLAMAAYYLHTNGQAERCNKTMILILNQCVSEHQHDWYLIAQPLTYACNRQAPRLTSTVPFSLVLSCHFPSPTIFEQPLHCQRISTCQPHLLYSSMAFCTEWRQCVSLWTSISPPCKLDIRRTMAFVLVPQPRSNETIRNTSTTRC